MLWGVDVMPNLSQAPVLKHNGEKFSSSKNHYEIPQDIADVVFSELTGNATAQLKVMLVLIGTKPGFKISEQWILDRTGINHSSYVRARQALGERGWITHNASSGEIIVNFDKIRPPQQSTPDSSSTGFKF